MLRRPPIEPGASESTPRRGLRQAVVAFRHREYTLFWTGALVSNIGTWMQNVTVPYVLFKITGNASWVGIAAFVQLFPTVVVGPWAGALADRRPRRQVLIVTQILQGVLALALWAAWVAGVRTPLWIVVLLALGGLVQGATMPSWQAFVGELVPREDLLNAITLNSAQFNAARAVGPAVAGVLLGVFGPSWAFLFNAVSYGAVVTGVALIGRRPAPVRTDSRRSALREFADGLRLARRERGVFVAIITVVLVALVGMPVSSLSAVFADRVFHVSAGAYGVLSAALGAGAVAGAVVIGVLGGTVSRSRLVALCLLGFSVAILALAVAPSFPLAVLAVALNGLCFLGVVSSLNTAVQLLVPEAMKGRVLAAYMMCFTASFPVGALAAGWLAEARGARFTAFGAGTLMLAGSLVLVLRRGLLASVDGPPAVPDAVLPAPDLLAGETAVARLAG